MFMYSETTVVLSVRAKNICSVQWRRAAGLPCCKEGYCTALQKSLYFWPIQNWRGEVITTFLSVEGSTFLCQQCLSRCYAVVSLCCNGAYIWNLQLTQN